MNFSYNVTFLIPLALGIIGVGLPALRWFLRRQRSGVAVRDAARDRRRAAASLGLATATLDSESGPVNGVPVTLQTLPAANGRATSVRIRVECQAPFTFATRPPGPGAVFVGDLPALSFAGSPADVLAVLSHPVREKLAQVPAENLCLAPGVLQADQPGPLSVEKIEAATRALVELATLLTAERRGERISALAERAVGDPQPPVRLAALLASAGLDSTLTCTCLEDPDPAVRAAAAMFLMHLGGSALENARHDAAIEPALVELLQRDGAFEQVREFALRALSELGSPAAVTALNDAWPESERALHRLRERFDTARGAISISEDGGAGGLSLSRAAGALALTKTRGGS